MRPTTLNPSRDATPATRDASPSDEPDYLALLATHDARTLDVGAARRDHHDVRVVFDASRGVFEIVPDASDASDAADTSRARVFKRG